MVVSNLHIVWLFWNVKSYIDATVQ